MKRQVQLIIFSHLSDVQSEPLGENNRLKINWIKYLLMLYPDTTTLIDVDEVWEEFTQKYPNLVNATT